MENPDDIKQPEVEKTATAFGNPAMPEVEKTATAPRNPAMPEVEKTATAPRNPAMPEVEKTATAPRNPASPVEKTASAFNAVPAGNPLPASGYKEGDTITVGGKNYIVEKELGRGGEGTIYIVKKGRRRYALKKYNPTSKVNMAVMPALQKLNDKHVLVEIVDYAEDFELLEYVPGGSAAAAGIKGNKEAITGIMLKTAFALDEMHKAGIIHKDIKPANILIKDRDTWNSVVCDFGIADVLGPKGSVSTPQTRTPTYAAPEVYDPQNTSTLGAVTYCELTPKADFYSLGMTVLSLWMGEAKFRQKEHELSMDKKKGRIEIPEDMPDPLNKICRGLLIKDPGKRWDLDEIVRTIEGEDVEVEEDWRLADLNITFSATKHLYANTPKELADCMCEDPELGIHYLYDGTVEKWLKECDPGLAREIHDIWENRLKDNHELGRFAAVCTLDPKRPYLLVGTSRETGETVEKDCVTLKDVSDFCNDVLLDDQSISDLEDDYFKEWVRVRDASIVESFPDPDDNVFAGVYMLRVQLIDPLTDIALRNDPNHPDYAMTGEGIGRFLNKIYNIFWNICEGDLEKVDSIWNRKEYAPLNRQISVDMIRCVAASIIDTVEERYFVDFLNTKGYRFKDQLRWFYSATDRESQEYEEKAGPDDDLYFFQSSWMKIIKGYGATPEYLFTGSNRTVTTPNEVFSESKKVLKDEFENKGLRGFLAVCRMDDPTVNLKPQFTYEKLLQQYVLDMERIDDTMEPVVRYNRAVKEAERLLGEGKSKIRSLNARNLAQYILTLLLAVVPAVLLLAMLVFSIIENPLVDTSSLHLQNYIWIVGIVLGVGTYFINLRDDENVGCIGSIIGGLIIAVILYFLVRFLGQFILYFYAAVVLVVLVFFSMRTIFSPSPYARKARKFIKPGFDEKVLEPLYYAFDDEDEFDSSLNGAFNEEEMQNWKADLRVRRIFMLIFIGVVWFLLLFSMLIPKSERFDRLTAPFVERIFGSSPVEEETIEPYILRPLQKGDKGEEVMKLQNFLREQGYSKGRADGDYGRGTQKAVEAFQQAQGLEVTGIVDSLTIIEISKIVAAQAAAQAAETQPETPVKPEQKTQPESKPKAAPTPKPAEQSAPAAQPAAEKPTEKPAEQPAAEPAPAQTATPVESDVQSISLDQLIKVTNQNNNP